MSSPDPFQAALPQVPYSDFLAEALRYTYDATRFKKIAAATLATVSVRESAARQTMSKTADTMKKVGAAAGIPGGPFAIGTLAANAASLMYHLVEMCGVMAEIYGLDTRDDRVKALVLAGASSDFELMDQALRLVQAENLATTPLSKSFVVSILLALQLNLGLQAAVRLDKVIPFFSVLTVSWSNFRTVKNTGRAFLEKLQLKL